MSPRLSARYLVAVSFIIGLTCLALLALTLWLPAAPWWVGVGLLLAFAGAHYVVTSRELERVRMEQNARWWREWSAYAKRLRARGRP